MNGHDNPLAKLSAATFDLAKASTLEEVKHIMDIAEAAKTYARAAKLGLEAQNNAAALTLRAARKAGDMLAQVEREPGKRTDMQPRNSVLQGSPYSALLKENKIDRMTAQRWQQMATLPEELFEAHRCQVVSEGKELTSTGVLACVHEHQRTEKYAAMQTPDYWPSGQYRILYVDPPWRYDRNQAGVTAGGGRAFGKAECHYPTMSFEELCALRPKVDAIAYPDSVLFLWATSPLLDQGIDLVRAWGFRHTASYVWDKVRHNVGYYGSVRHEILLLGKRGTGVPEGEKPNDSVFPIERTDEHSEKPEFFRHMIDAMYPSGPRIELYARPPEGYMLPEHWHSWGNEVAAASPDAIIG
jgi:N6-adenosine-specific RNA methylase IME4